MSERGRARRRELDALRNESDVAWTIRALSWSRQVVNANMPDATDFQREVLAAQMVLDAAKDAGRTAIRPLHLVHGAR